MKKLILFIAFLFAASTTYGQSVSKISGRCQSPYQSQYEVIQAIAAGDLYYVPCPTRSSVFFGLVDFSNATVSGLPFTVSPLTTKGDLWGFSTVNARVPVGTNGQVLTADSTQALGVKWATPTSGSGTLNTLAKWTSGTALGNSLITDDGTNVGIATVAGKTTQIGGGNANGLSAGASQTVIGDWNGINNGTSITVADNLQTISTDSVSTFSTNTVTPLTIAGSQAGTLLKPFASVTIGGAANTTTRLTSNATANRAVTFPDTSGNVLLGTGTVNLLPRFATGGNTLVTTPLSWDGTVYVASDTARTAAFDLEFTPASTAGSGTGLWQVGSPYTGNANALGMYSYQGTHTTQIYGDTFVGVNTRHGRMGDWIGIGNGTGFDITDSTKTFSFLDSANDAIFNLVGIQNFQLQRTVTAAGTTGAQTINKPNGSVNFAAGASSLVVTDSVAGTSSLIIATANTNDATCSVKNVVSAAGSFTITMTAACTAETRVGFFVWN